jgi:hypothetical protein
MINDKMNAEINQRVILINKDLRKSEINEKGTVINIIGYGIDILMDNGTEYRVINSDFNKYFKKDDIKT